MRFCFPQSNPGDGLRGSPRKFFPVLSGLAEPSKVALENFLPRGFFLLFPPSNPGDGIRGSPRKFSPALSGPLPP